MARKLIVTSESALMRKYGTAGWDRIEKAVQALVKADAARGIDTTLVSLDVKKVGKKGVPKAHKREVKKKTTKASTDFQSVKSAIDDAFTAASRPEYLMILGGPDVVPLQTLRNPADDDDGPELPADVPYACEAKAGDKAERFTVASRAVGRLPDLPGSTDPRLLLALLKRAAAWTPLSKAAYSGFFGLSAAVWQKSTTLSLQALFGKSAKTRLSPVEGPTWKTADLSARAHFINCHGAPSDPQFYGQSGRSFPVAHHSAKLKGLVKEGTVVAAECCFGAELYEPSNGATGICAAYLVEGAIGFLGSTTTAYGPADSNGAADLVCRYFLEAVLGGDSLGKALLVARQRFAEAAAPLSPIDLKTIAQFYLLGDPSLHAIATAATKAGAKASKPGAKSLGMARLSAPRAALESNAASIAGQLECVRTQDDGKAPPDMASALEAEARKHGLVPASAPKTFEVRRPEGASLEGVSPKGGGGPVARLESVSLEKRAPTGMKFHVMFADAPADELESAGAKGRDRRPRSQGISKKVCLLAREVGGRLGEIERLWARTGGEREGSVRRTGGAKARRHGIQERPRGRRPAD